MVCQSASGVRSRYRLRRCAKRIECTVRRLATLPSHVGGCVSHRLRVRSGGRRPLACARGSCRPAYATRRHVPSEPPARAGGQPTASGLIPVSAAQRTGTTPRLREGLIREGLTPPLRHWMPARRGATKTRANAPKLRVFGTKGRVVSPGVSAGTRPRCTHGLSGRTLSRTRFFKTSGDFFTLDLMRRNVCRAREHAAVRGPCPGRPRRSGARLLHRGEPGVGSGLDPGLDPGLVQGLDQVLDLAVSSFILRGREGDPSCPAECSAVGISSAVW